MNKKRLLSTPEDFNRYITFQRPISIYQQNEFFAYDIIIKSQSKETVTSSTKDHYVKSACQFYA